MSVLALGLGLVAFVLVLRVMKAQQIVSTIVSTSQNAVVAIADGTLSDDDKEATVRRASITLFGQFLRIAAVAAVAVGASAAIVWIGIAVGLYSLDRVVEVALGWPFLLGSFAAAVAIWIALEKRKPRRAAEEPASEDVPYSPLDKALHTYAFASPERQKTLADLETRLYRRRIDPERAARPVFVTSLPRAGTTVLLNALARLPEFASATYRHMPFTLAPLLWGGLSGAFRKAGEAAERAHGDGIEVGFDSPEAFEEMVWMAFWPDHYEARRIRPWSVDDRSPEFEAFFRTHMAKVVATKNGAQRYLSKNNANIARLDLIGAAFPDATVVIPIRDPRAQIASLMRQHARFQTLHAREPFARQYMEGIGHYEFGAALKPIAFGGQAFDPSEADAPDMWLRYWIAAYEAVLARKASNHVFVDHDALCASPHAHLRLLADAVGTRTPDALTGQGGTFRPTRPPPELAGASPRLLARAAELHAELARSALAPMQPEGMPT